MAPNRELARTLEARTRSEKCACGQPLSVAVDPAIYDYVLRCQACGNNPATTARYEPGLKQRYRRALSLEAAGMTAIDAQMLAGVLRKEIEWAEARGERPSALTVQLLARLNEETGNMQPNQSHALTVTGPKQAVVYSTEEIDIIKQQIAVGVSDRELDLFLATAQRRGLDPFAKQIYAVVRRRKNARTQEWENYMVMQTGIDGYRLIAARGQNYAGQDETEYGPMIPDAGVKGGFHPEWASTTGYKIVKGLRVPFTAKVWWDERVQTTSDGKPNSMWASQPRSQLAKCSESAMLRKGWPEEMSGLEYRDEAPPEQLDAYPDVDRATGEVASAPPVADAADAEFAIEGEFFPLSETPDAEPDAAEMDRRLDEYLAGIGANRAAIDKFLSASQNFSGASWEQMDGHTRGVALHDLKQAVAAKRQQARSSAGAVS